MKSLSIHFRSSFCCLSPQAGTCIIIVEMVSILARTLEAIGHFQLLLLSWHISHVIGSGNLRQFGSFEPRASCDSCLRTVLTLLLIGDQHKMLPQHRQKCERFKPREHSQPPPFSHQERSSKWFSGAQPFHKQLIIGRKIDAPVLWWCFYTPTETMGDTNPPIAHIRVFLVS